MKERTQIMLRKELRQKSIRCKNGQLLKNWKAISLLNVDYTIGVKALANGLQNILHYVINPDQTCNIPGRLILDNFYLIHDSSEHIFQK